MHAIRTCITSKKKQMMFSHWNLKGILIFSGQIHRDIVKCEGPYEFLEFCVLECSGCKQKKRTKDRKDFECPKCNRKTALVPRDGTATTTASISGELGEKLLSMTAEDIFDITCAKELLHSIL